MVAEAPRRQVPSHPHSGLIPSKAGFKDALFAGNPSSQTGSVKFPLYYPLPVGVTFLRGKTPLIWQRAVSLSVNLKSRRCGGTGQSGYRPHPVNGLYLPARVSDTTRCL